MSRYDEFPYPGLPSISELTDASNECRHGRLPFDPGPRCSCWHVSWQPKRAPVRHEVVWTRRRYAGGRYRFPEHVRRRAVALYREGLSLEAAGVRVGASRNSVKAWVLEAGVVVRGRWERAA